MNFSAINMFSENYVYIIMLNIKKLKPSYYYFINVSDVLSQPIILQSLCIGGATLFPYEYC